MKALALIATCLFSSYLYAGIAVVVHPSNNVTLTKDDVSRIYTGRASSFSNGEAAVPVNLADAVALRSEFDQKALGRSSSQVKAYWSKLVFTGKGTPPKEVVTSAEVLQLVKTNPNIIGYVDPSEVTSEVKVVLTLD